MRARLRIWCSAIALGVLVTHGEAHAQEARRRAVLISPGRELEDAARAALEPWRVELVVIDVASPGATAPQANEVARNLAFVHGASAVVWISAALGHVLWVYDVASQRVVERPLNTEPPFDAAAAAAVALSIKTLLRHSTAAPESERYGVADAPEDAAGAFAQPAQSAQAPQPEPAAVAAADVSVRDAADVNRSPANRPRRPSLLDLSAGAGLGFHLAGSSAALSRFGGEVVWWPGAGRFGAGASVSTGPGARVVEPLLRGRLVDTAVGVAFHVRSDPLRALRLSAAAGGGLHVLALSGELPSEVRAIEVLRAAPALDLALHADWLIASELFVGVRGGAALLVRTERYFVSDQRVLALARVAFDAGLAIGLSLQP